MIYFVQAQILGRIKIGYTSKGRLEKRLSALRTASPVALLVLAVCPGTLEHEKQLHARFDRYRLHGEWFRPGRGLVRYIAGINGRSVPSNGRATRGLRAVAFLERAFRERGEWPSDELKRAAIEAGLSKNALWSPEVGALPIRKRRVMDSDGNCWWAWRAEDGWPNGKEVSS